MNSPTRASRSRGGLDEATLDLIDQVGVSGSDADELVREVLTTTLAVLPCEHPILLLVGEDGAARLYTALDDGAVIGMPFREEGTVLSEALRTGRPGVVGGLEGREDAGVVLTRMFQASTLIHAPLRAGERTFGALAIVDPASGDQSGHLADLRLVAGRVAVAFTATGARERLRREVADAEFLLEKLYRADQNKTDLLSVVSHEVKNPITNIIGFAKALEDGWSSIADEKRRHFLGVIAREGQRAARLVEDVLDLARLESGSLTCVLEPTSLSEVIDEALAATKAAWEDHSLTVDVDEALPRVAADGDRVGQVIRNLLINACRYAPKGTGVSIRATAISDGDGPIVLVSMTDEGPGIPEDEQGLLFDKFARLSTSEGAEKGAGLGLFISKGIVEAHGGRIWVKSKPGNGATFYFTLRPV